MDWSPVTGTSTGNRGFNSGVAETLYNDLVAELDDLLQRNPKQYYTVANNVYKQVL